MIPVVMFFAKTIFPLWRFLPFLIFDHDLLSITVSGVFCTTEPSIWQFSNDDDLERIALGLMLYKGNLDKIEFIGFDECCFEKASIEIRQATNHQFPLPSVGSLHHELHAAPDTNLIQSVELFLNCNGNFKRFPKASDSATDLSMLSIAKKYIKEITGATHINKANEWIEKYG